MNPMHKMSELAERPEQDELPRLLYLGDVPVESSYHGSALLFRLLQDYPTDRLLVIEAGLVASQLERRLAAVRYQRLAVANRRLLHTRFAPWYSAWLTVTAAQRSAKIAALLQGFQPDAVLTVAHGYAWITAARFAQRHRVPLHLICHDDWPGVANLPRAAHKKLDASFGAIYRQAASRLCVSPGMAENYHNSYAADGVVLYPSRAADCPEFVVPPERLAHNDHPFTMAFAGTVSSPGYLGALRRVAQALQGIGGQLLLFGPLDADSARQSGWSADNVIFGGMVGARQLLAQLRARADALFVPMSFEPAERVNMAAGFPSKLADCSAVGVPMLIYGPPYCSAVRWARENPGVAEVVDQESDSSLMAALRRLAEQPSLRTALGRIAQLTGKRYFSHQAAQAIFHRSLRSPATVA